MTSKEAMLDALNRRKVKMKYKPGTLRQMKKRVLDGNMSRDAMVEFLLDNRFTMKTDIIWSKPRAKAINLITNQTQAHANNQELSTPITE